MIRSRREGDVAELELCGPPCNEIGSVLTGELEGFLASLRQHPPKALVVHSSLDAGFCAGADLRELYREVLARESGQARRELSSFLDRIHRVMNTLDTLPFPTIGVVRGACFGGGFELALTLDVLIAEPAARFCFPELRLGIVPGFGGIPRLRRDAGNALIRDLLFTGRSIGADKALVAGLVSQTAASGRGLEIARKTAAQMAKYDAGVLAASKAFIKPIPLDELEREKELFLKMFESPVVLAGLKKFVESQDVRPYLA